MIGSFKVATVAGTEVKIHPTFSLLLAFVAWQTMSTGASASMALQAISLVCAMFFCVLLHEFGHVTAARWYGIKTPDITLYPIGGVARLERMPSKPSEELVVALCGPLVNVVIAGVLALIFGIPTWEELENSLSRFKELAWTLMAWNIMMVIFNMIPAFPMDGGRVLRALLAMGTGDFTKATRWAAKLGQGIAIVTMVWLVTSGQVAHSPMLLLIALFVFIAAGQESAMVARREESRGLLVEDAMMTDFHRLPLRASLRDAVVLLRAGSQQDFPVVDAAGEVLGLLARRDLIQALADHGPEHSAQAIMVPFPGNLHPQMPLEDALAALTEADLPALPVIEPFGQRLIGLFTAENAGEVMLIQSALRRR